MGHDPDLGAELKKQAHPFEIEVKITDVLRDRQDLRFKREAEARVVSVGSGNKRMLKIKSFYPLNLMQKLSMEKATVSKWQELVESVLIDFHYNSTVLRPEITDIPEKDALVSGEYPVPEDAGNIRVKITEFISESLERDVEGE